jgi:hypothetical protein
MGLQLKIFNKNFIVEIVLMIFGVIWFVVYGASIFSFIQIGYTGVEWVLLFIASFFFMIGFLLSFIKKWAKLKPFKFLTIIGITISMLMYISAIWIGDFAVNPQTQDIGIWIQNNLPSFVYLNTHQYLLDALLFSGFVLALIGTFFVYKKKGNVYAIEQTLFIYSVFIAIMIFITVDVTKWLATSLFGVGVAITGFPSWNYGFPTWTYQVTTSTSFLKYSDFTMNNPNVYFLNYWQLFVICICIALITRVLIKRKNSFVSTYIGFFASVYKFLKGLKD